MKRYDSAPGIAAMRGRTSWWIGRTMLLPVAVVVALSLCALFPCQSDADAVDVTLTGGAVGAGTIDDWAAHFLITGNGFLWCCGGLEDALVSPAAIPLWPGGASTPIEAGMLIFGPSPGDSIVLNGSLYHYSFPQPALFPLTFPFGGTILFPVRFTTAPVVLPPICMPFLCPSSTTVSTPFTMIGDLLLSNASQQVEVTLRGNGMATADFRGGSGLWELVSLHYNFVPEVPEPSSFLLAATGLACMAVWRQMKRL